MGIPEREIAITRYQPRTVTSLGLWFSSPFAFKIYGLSDRDRSLDGDDWLDAKVWAETRLADIPVEPGGKYPGFIIVHKGSEGVSLLIHWWVEGCILCHDLIRRPYDGVDPIASLRPHVAGCIWELAILGHERTVWQKTMMSESPDVDAYLRSWLEAPTV